MCSIFFLKPSFTYSLTKYVLNTYFVPGNVLGRHSTKENKDTIACMLAYILEGRTYDKANKLINYIMLEGDKCSGDK